MGEKGNPQGGPDGAPEQGLPCIFTELTSDSEGGCGSRSLESRNLFQVLDLRLYTGGV